MVKALAFIFSFSILSISTFAQKSQDSSAVEQFMSLGQKQFELENYRAADITFRKILNMRTFIPDELCYFYGNTLYQLQDYRLSESFLSKYLELTDTSARFYDTTTTLLEIVDSKIKLIEACTECDEDGFRTEFITCHVCHGDGHEVGPCNRCDGSGDEICKVCFGEKVEVQKTSFGRRYVPCTNCNETGFVDCTKCKGEKVLEYRCHECGGKGKLSKKVRVIE